ncbi:MAG: hypothetical protein IKT39_02430 [Clostridia bacterium]|nr:hypothetical protein [Clostridia bacterium]
MNIQIGKEKLNKIFDVAIIAILIAGVVAGVALGNTLKVPSEKAIEAAEKLTSSFANRKYWESYLQEKAWTANCTFAMLGTWVGCLFGAFLLYVKKVQMNMIDEIRLSLKKDEGSDKKDS